METLDLILGKNDEQFFVEAAKTFDCEIIISGNKALISGPMMQSIARVCYWAGYLKANDMHKSISQKYSQT